MVFPIPGFFRVKGFHPFWKLPLLRFEVEQPLVSFPGVNLELFFLGR